MSLISVVIPSYNEQENIERTASVLAEILGRTEMEYELIFVDDGSKDETYARICAEADKNPRIKGCASAAISVRRPPFSPGCGRPRGTAVWSSTAICSIRRR